VRKQLDRNFLQARRSQRRTIAGREKRKEIVNLVLGDGRGNVGIENSYVCLARLLQEKNMEKIVRCLNYETAYLEGLLVEAVRLEHPTFEAAYRVIGRASRVTPNPPEDGPWPPDPYLPQHGWTHTWPAYGGAAVGEHVGRDKVSVTIRNLEPFRAQAQVSPNMTTYVNAGWYYSNGFRFWPGGNSPPFSAPDHGTVLGLLYFRLEDSTFGVRYGSVGTPTILPPPPPLYNGEWSLAFVELMAGQEYINESHIIDARIIFNLSVGGGVGPPGPPGPPGPVATTPNSIPRCGA
jgi:hypothetical protein